MSDNIFTRMGWSLKKPSIDNQNVDTTNEVIDEGLEFRLSANDKLSLNTAKMYSTAMTKDFFDTLISEYNYKDIIFGSRKVARLCDLCRSILDIEIQEGLSEFNDKEPNFKKSDHNDVLRLLFYMCWLFPIPLRKHTQMKDVRSVYSEKFKQWLVFDYELVKELEVELVLEGVFKGINSPDNPILDIFHDALRIEDSYSSYKIDHNLMKTTLGKNSVFTSHSRLRADKNVTPTWIVYFSEIMESDELIDIKKKKEDEDYFDTDSIS